MPTSLWENFNLFKKYVKENNCSTLEDLDESYLSASFLLPFLHFIELNGADGMSDQSLEKYFENFISQKNLKYLQFIFKRLKKFPSNYFQHSGDIDSYVDNFSDELFESINLDLDSNSAYLLLFELLNNIYKHSIFQNAYVLCQSYFDSGIIEICIIDDGVTIPNSLKSNNVSFESDSEAIFKALNGATSDKEKENRHGRGLNTCSNIVVFGYGEELLVASRKGLVIVAENGVKCIDDEDISLDGTLICLRINTNKINNIYNYVKRIKFEKL